MTVVHFPLPSMSGFSSRYLSINFVRAVANHTPLSVLPFSTPDLNTVIHELQVLSNVLHVIVAEQDLVGATHKILIEVRVGVLLTTLRPFTVQLTVTVVVSILPPALFFPKRLLNLHTP